MFTTVVALLALVAAVGALWLNYDQFKKLKALKASIKPPDLSDLAKRSELEGLVKWDAVRAYLHEHYPAMSHLTTYYAQKSYVDNGFVRRAHADETYAKKSEIPSRDSIFVDPGAVDHITLNQHTQVLKHLVTAALAELQLKVSPIEEDIQRLLLERQEYSEKLNLATSTRDAARASVDALKASQLGSHPTGREMQEFASRMEKEGRDAHVEWTSYVLDERNKVREERAAQLASAEADLSRAEHELFQAQHKGDMKRQGEALKAFKLQHRAFKQVEDSLKRDLTALEEPDPDTEAVTDEELSSD